MPHSTTHDPGSDEIALTDPGLISLIDQYPDIVEALNNEEIENQSRSPTRSFTSEDEGQSTTLSDTTSQTTPPRNEPAEPVHSSRAIAEFPRFLHELETSNLPERAVEYLKALGYTVLEIGQTLFPPNGNIAVNRKDLQKIKNLCQHIVPLLEGSGRRVDDQIENIAHILTLAPFTIRPAPEDLWANYNQMAEVIIQNCQLPSMTECRLYQHLTLVFDTYVYHPASVLFRTGDYDKDVQSSIDRLYHAIMSVAEKYKQWCRDMRDLGDWYTKPTMRRILNSPAIMEQILEFEGMKEAAEAATRDPKGPGIQPLTRKVLESFNADTRRRQELVARSKSRMRREHTL